MARRYIDCRDHAESGGKCTIAISADSIDEVVEAAVQHATAVHGLEDGPDLRKQLNTMVKEGSPRA